MADKSFGVKELNIIGTGTPTIQSPSGGDLNITAATADSATISYAWDKSEDNAVWHQIPGATSSSYTNILYVSPSTSSIFIKYIRSLAGENYDGNDLTDNIPVTETLSPVVLGIAESELWKSDNAEGRAKSAYAEAINILTALEAQ